jgi:hypothetical protein
LADTKARISTDYATTMGRGLASAIRILLTNVLVTGC